MKPSRITHIRATPVTVPLQAPLLHSNGAHWGRFVRTIVEVETDDGYVGLGTAFNFAPGRLSYLLGLQGPSLAVDTEIGRASCRERVSSPV